MKKHKGCSAAWPRSDSSGSQRGARVSWCKAELFSCFSVFVAATHSFPVWHTRGRELNLEYHNSPMSVVGSWTQVQPTVLAQVGINSFEFVVRACVTRIMTLLTQCLCGHFSNNMTATCFPLFPVQEVFSVSSSFKRIVLGNTYHFLAKS